MTRVYATEYRTYTTRQTCDECGCDGELRIRPVDKAGWWPGDHTCGGCFEKHPREHDWTDLELVQEARK